MSGCLQEMCPNWPGIGCVNGMIECPDAPKSGPECDVCDDPAEFGVQPEDVDTKYACTKHLAMISRAAIEAWGEHGVICIFSAMEDED